MNERRNVVGYEGIYEVSEDGKVFRVVTGRELKLTLAKHGYFVVGLSDYKQTKQKYLHRLLAEAFLENPENLPQINHKDCNKQNNCIANLEWCTHQQNIVHAYANKRIKQQRKAVVGTHLITGERIEFNSTKDAQHFGFDRRHISRCCRGIKSHHTHKGYKWTWKVDE